MEFEIVAKDVMGRIGKLKTSSGTIETPTVLPVINPNIQIIEPREMRRYGAEAIITNSYIIYRSEELRERTLREGLHGMLNWDGVVMTDSGAFQLSEFGDIEIDNEEIIRFQEQIGSDILVPLDIPTPPDVERSQAEDELKETLRRLKEARNLSKMPMAGPVQGSTFLDLREESARKVGEIGFEIYPLGAVVPLMESYRYADLVDVIASSKKFLPPSAPVHLFGAGHPMVFALAVLMGCDIFDSAAYALYAKKGRYLTNHKTYSIDDLFHLPCSCPICTSYGPKDLKNDLKLLSEHNLYVTFEEIRLIKQSIREGNLWELTERRCRAHPFLLDGLKRAMKYVELMEKFDPVSKSTFYYLGQTSARRSEVYRYAKMLDRFDISGRVLIFAGRDVKGWKKEGFDHIFLMKAPFGPYPIELKGTYPIYQSEGPKEMDYEAITVALENVLKLIDNYDDVEFVFVYDDRWEHPLIGEIGKSSSLVKL